MAKIPDAVVIPEEWKRGSNSNDRNLSLIAIAERMLGVDLTTGERAWMRLQPHGRMFVTKSIYDTIQFAKDHHLAGKPRYFWVAQEDGSEFGYLVPEAKPATTEVASA